VTVNKFQLSTLARPGGPAFIVILALDSLARSTLSTLSALLPLQAYDLLGSAQKVSVPYFLTAVHPHERAEMMAVYTTYRDSAGDDAGAVFGLAAGLSVVSGFFASGTIMLILAGVASYIPKVWAGTGAGISASQWRPSCGFCTTRYCRRSFCTDGSENCIRPKRRSVANLEFEEFAIGYCSFKKATKPSSSAQLRFP
jgi:hypothetical protein